LQAYGIEVAERLELPSRTSDANLVYLRTKRDRMGHLLALP